MRFLVALALSSLALASANVHHKKHHTPAPSEKQLEEQFTHFIKSHEKKYTHDEFFHRFNAFKTNMEKIRIHNNGDHTFTLGVNAHADLTWAEFKATRFGYKSVDRSVLKAKNSVKLSASAAPTSVDWRAKGVVTPVKDQGQCGSCWAFSTTGSTEGAHALKTGDLVSLSEQQLVDCSAAEGNQGCSGGLMDNGFQYIITNKGITSEASYPYTAADGSCKSGLSTVTTLSSFTDVPAGDENALLAAVAKQPVSIAIEADQEAFQLYSGGVFTAACGTALDHGVLAVGYGTDAGKDYWIVKNSWGASWGEAGYIRLVRGQNQCGLANDASYPEA